MLVSLYSTIKMMHGPINTRNNTYITLNYFTEYIVVF